MCSCYRCGKILPYGLTITVGQPLPDDAWHMVNPCPNGAAGFGQTVMIPVCNKCDPMPTLFRGTFTHTHAY